jgi:hypothetical protein
MDDIPCAMFFGAGAVLLRGGGGGGPARGGPGGGGGGTALLHFKHHQIFKHLFDYQISRRWSKTFSSFSQVEVVGFPAAAAAAVDRPAFLVEAVEVAAEEFPSLWFKISLILK